MTCDEVFDLITGEQAAESGRHRDTMRKHLAACRSCRRLADALEPAVELFRECAAGDDAHGHGQGILPGPWSESGQLGYAEPASPSGRLGNWSILSAAGPSSTPWMWQVFGGDLLRLAAAVLVGLTLGALVWGQSKSAGMAANAAPGGLALSPPGSSSSPRVTLATLRLTADCVPPERLAAAAASGPRVQPALELLASARLDALACCTLCHAMGIGGNSKAATQDVIRSCQACHTF